MNIYEFDAVILKHESLDSVYIEFPYDVRQEFGTDGQVKVDATFNGHRYRGSLAKMGRSRHFLGITQEVRRAIGKNAGDIVHVVLKKDEEPRTVELPDDLAAALVEEPEARAFLESLSYTNRKEFITWVAEAKRPETRERRVTETVQLLKSGQKKR